MKTQTIPQHRLAPWPLKNMTGDLQAPTVTAISDLTLRRESVGSKQD